MNEPTSTRRSRWRLWSLAGLAVVLLAAILLWRAVDGRKEVEADQDKPGAARETSKEADRDKPAAAPQRIATVDGQSVVKLDEETQRRSGIETTPVSTASGREPVRAYAAVLDVARLTELSNSALNAQVQVSAANAKIAASRAAFLRAQTLYLDSQNVSLAVLQAAEAAYAADRAALAAAQAQAATFGATARQEFGPALGGLQSGLVADLIQRRRVLLQITAPPGSAIGEPPATVTVQADAGRQVQAQRVSTAARTDPKVQGVSFYYVASAESGLLPGMNVLALLPTGEARSGAVVPPSAVVYWQGQSWAYLRRDEDAFQRIPVSTATPAPQGGYVVQGLAPGARLVTRGAQLLLSEELRPQAQAGGGDPDGGND